MGCCCEISRRTHIAFVVLCLELAAGFQPLSGRTTWQTQRPSSIGGGSINQWRKMPAPLNHRMAQTSGEGSIAGENVKKTSSSVSSKNKPNHQLATMSASFGLWSLLALASSTPFSPAHAYDPSDYASETVQKTIQTIKEAEGNAADTFSAYERLADIITEGTGVGGAINYKGVQLERGYIADEDTTIYNPGLTLLTESEKERLVEAVVQSRTAGLQAGTWNDNSQFAFDFLREKLDPFHMRELSGYLGVLPFVAGVVYLAVLAVQQLARDLFPVAYMVGAAIVFAPVLVLVLLGP